MPVSVGALTLTLMASRNYSLSHTEDPPGRGSQRIEGLYFPSPYIISTLKIPWKFLML